ncbi:TPA: hypothetical protein P0E21_004024 [Vibrio harveyi]|nr:hypothetical protein [Vibrio harveyi]HDM8150393.1 hypothetical protein [Vibrio harveyi]
MNVFRICDDHEHFKTMCSTPDEIATQLGDFNLFERILSQPTENDSLQDIWKQVDVCFEDVLANNSQIPDVSLWLRTFLVLSPKAHNALKEHLGSVGEFLPLRFDGDSWYLYSSFQFGQEDRDQCIEKIEYGFLAGVERLVFIDSDVDKKMLFKSKLDEASNLFCNQKFVEVFQEHDLRGITFTDELAGSL